MRRGSPPRTRRRSRSCGGTLGLSVDWSQTYTTIGERSPACVAARRSCACAQRGLAYTAEAPTLWDVDFQTAVAQAELEDREQPGAYHRIAFDREDGAGGVRDRDDAARADPGLRRAGRAPRRRALQAALRHDVLTPLFGVPVPVVAHELADPEKGTGIAMICTFGDVTDVTWWRELALPVRAVIRRTARSRPVRFGEPGWESRDRRPPRTPRWPSSPASGREAGARDASSSCCAAAGDLVGEPGRSRHAVKFYEKGDRPLEIVTSRQWFMQDRSRSSEELLARGARARSGTRRTCGARYENWVDGPRTATGASAASGSSACRSRSGTRSTRTDGRRLRRAALRRRGDAADRPVDRRARRATRADQRGISPAASPAIPT